MMGSRYEDFNSPKRQSLIQLFITCGSRITALSSTGAILGDYNEQGELRAVLVSRRLNGPPSDTCLTCYLCCTGTLACETCCLCCAPDADNISKRSEAVEKAFKKLHETHGKGDHIYVNVVAVSPEHRGKVSSGAPSRPPPPPPNTLAPHAPLCCAPSTINEPSRTPPRARARAS